MSAARIGLPHLPHLPRLPPHGSRLTAHGARRRRRAAARERRRPACGQAEPQVWEEAGAYLDADAVFEHNVTHEWNHGIGEIVTALLDAGMTLTGLAEHDSVPWNALPGMMTETDGEWRLSENPARLPCSFTIQAVKEP